MRAIVKVQLRLIELFNLLPLDMKNSIDNGNFYKKSIFDTKNIGHLMFSPKKKRTFITFALQHIQMFYIFIKFVFAHKSLEFPAVHADSEKNKMDKIL